MSSYDEFHETEGAGQTRSGRASDVRGNYQQTRGGNVATQDGSNPMGAGGRSADFGSAGGQAQGTARKVYTARALYSEYLDDYRNLQQIARRGTISRNIMGQDTVTFTRREDELAYKSSNADVFKFENDNAMCDGGDSGACSRAGRGSAPTEYASPFTSSAHFNDVAYFGGGGRTESAVMKTRTEAQLPETGDGSSLEPPETEQPDIQPPESVPEPIPEPEPEEMGFPPLPAEPINNEGTSGLDPSADSDGSHPGGDGSASSTGGEIVPLPQENTTGVNELPRGRTTMVLNLPFRDTFNSRSCQGF